MGTICSKSTVSQQQLQPLKEHHQQQQPEDQKQQPMMVQQAENQQQENQNLSQDQQSAINCQSDQETNNPDVDPAIDKHDAAAVALQQQQQQDGSSHRSPRPTASVKFTEPNTETDNDSDDVIPKSNSPSPTSDRATDRKRSLVGKNGQSPRSTKRLRSPPPPKPSETDVTDEDDGNKTESDMETKQSDFVSVDLLPVVDDVDAVADNCDDNVNADDKRSIGSAKRRSRRKSGMQLATDCCENPDEHGKPQSPQEVSSSLSSCRLSDDSGLGGVTSSQNDDDAAPSAASASRDNEKDTHSVHEHSTTSRSGSAVRNSTAGPTNETETATRARCSSTDIAPVSVDDGPEAPASSVLNPTAATARPQGARTSTEIKVSPLPTANASNTKNNNQSNGTKHSENRKLQAKPAALDDKYERRLPDNLPPLPAPLPAAKKTAALGGGGGGSETRRFVIDGDPSRFRIF